MRISIQELNAYLNKNKVSKRQIMRLVFYKYSLEEIQELINQLIIKASKQRKKLKVSASACTKHGESK